jgi:RNA polymerase primary sigma factor
MKKFVITKNITKINNDSLRIYLKEISSFNPHSKEEEIECLNRIKKGDEKAINELINNNLRFVISVAKKYTNNNNDLEDLINEGNIGLLMAVNNFKHDMNVKFISYAVWWIRKNIFDYLHNNGRLIRIPIHKINMLTKIDKKINEYEQKYHRNVDFSEIIDELDNEISDLDNKDGELKYKKLSNDFELLHLLNGKNINSLNQTLIEDEGNPITYGDVLSDNNPYSIPDYYLINNENLKIFESIINKLSQRDKYVIVNYFGLFNSTPKQLKEIAKEVGVTTETVRQIKDKTLIKLRNLFVN